MNDRTDKTSYKNSINTQQPETKTTDEDEQLGNSYTAGNSLKRKTKKLKKNQASPASDYANRNDQQPVNAPATASRAAQQQTANLQPRLRTLDKAMIDADATTDQVERAIEKLKDLVKKDRVRRNTSESKNWGAVFVAGLDSSLPYQDRLNPKVTLYFTYRRNTKANIPFRLQLNPQKLNARHVSSLIKLWAHVFPIGGDDVYRNAAFFRIDEAADKEGDLDDWILDRKESQVVTRFCTKTGRDGKIKTSYVGEDSAANGGALYDRFSAEVFRDADGEPVPLNRDTATHTLDQVKGVVRVESRRVFPTKLTYAELLQTPSAFSEYYLFDLSRLSPSDRRDTAFMGYTDLVRLRGMHGAKRRLFDTLGETAATKRLIADYEERLARCECEWWTQIDRTQQLGVLLDELPVRKFLKRIGK